MTDLVLISDKDWEPVDGQVCRVKVFTPWATAIDGRVASSMKGSPYASIDVECPALPQDTTGYVLHKVDFLNLWSAFNERGVAADEEVLVLWTREHLKSRARLIARFMPRMWVMVCPKQAFEIMTDNDFRPQLGALERYRAQAPIAQWKPDVME